MPSTSKSRAGWTEEMLNELRAAAPLSWDDCADFAFKWNRSQKSIQQKLSHHHIEYLPQRRTTAKVSPRITKQDLVVQIERQLRRKFPGLEKADRGALAKLAGAITEALS